MVKEQFGQKHLIISSHLDKQWKVQPVTVSSDVRKLRKLHNSIESHCRRLKAIGIHEAAYGRAFGASHLLISSFSHSHMQCNVGKVSGKTTLILDSHVIQISPSISSSFSIRSKLSLFRSLRISAYSFRITIHGGIWPQLLCFVFITFLTQHLGRNRLMVTST